MTDAPRNPDSDARSETVSETRRETVTGPAAQSITDARELSTGGDQAFERRSGAGVDRAPGPPAGEMRDDSGPTAAAAAAAGTRGAAIPRAAVVTPHDLVRWGPIVAGLVTSLSLFLVLSLLGVAAGAVAATATADPNAIATGGTIVTALVGLVAFVIGGFVAARAAGVSGRGRGALNGFLVWALGVTAILLLGALGVGALFGAAGSIFGQIRAANINPGQVQGQVQVTPSQAAEAVRNSALVGFVSLALPALAAAIGGALGARRASEVVEEV